jgi:hypothetical protein
MFFFAKEPKGPTLYRQSKTKLSGRMKKEIDKQHHGSCACETPYSRRLESVWFSALYTSKESCFSSVFHSPEPDVGQIHNLLFDNKSHTAFKEMNFSSVFQEPGRRIHVLD